MAAADVNVLGATPGGQFSSARARTADLDVVAGSRNAGTLIEGMSWTAMAHAWSEPSHVAVILSALVPFSSCAQ